MTTYFTSDHHFGHANIIGFCHRPYVSEYEVGSDGVGLREIRSCLEKMNEDLVERWNSVVQPTDEVYYLGDFAMGRLADNLPLATRLNGTKWLIPGNHDRPFEGKKNKEYEDVGFRICSASVHVFVGRRHVSRRPLLLCHFPYVGDSRHEERYAEHRPKDHGAWLLHGHTHGLWRQKGRMIDVGVDAWAGTPVSEQQIVELIEAGERDLEPIPWEG